MKIKDLIEELQEHNPETEVQLFITADRDGYEVYVMEEISDGAWAEVLAWEAEGMD